MPSSAPDMISHLLRQMESWRDLQNAKKARGMLPRAFFIEFMRVRSK